MKILKATKENEQYYSPDFIRGYNLGAKQQAEIMPERKKGHWIVNVENESTISGSCSACGWQAHLYEDDVVGMNFCPNCGADMRGDNE